MANLIQSRRTLGALLIASALALPGIQLAQPLAPVAAHAAGSAASPVGAQVVVESAAPQAAAFKPIITPIPIYYYNVSAPGLYPLQATASSVTVSWYNTSSSAQGFEVFRRDDWGNWQQVYQVPAGAGTNKYSWVDTSTDQSGQCYRVAAYNSTSTSYTGEECTVRPDPSRFPQGLPPGEPQIWWSGLSSTNDGTGELVNTAINQNVRYANRTFGVNLTFANSSLWRVEAQGGPHLMKGQAVALKVWGGGWLKYGHETFGVDLQLSATPVYEWYAIGEDNGQLPGGFPPTFGGADLTDGGSFALWNSSAQAYLASGYQTFGISLTWYKPGSGPAPTPTPAPTQRGVKTEQVLNCSVDQQPVEVFIADQTAGSGFVDEGRVNEQYGPAGCPAVGSAPLTFRPQSDHQYLLVATDSALSTCDGTNDPQEGGCIKMEAQFVGDASGYTRTDIVDDGTRISP